MTEVSYKENVSLDAFCIEREIKSELLRNYHVLMSNVMKIVKKLYIFISIPIAMS